MSQNIVNLDALIPREDLAILSGQPDVRKVDTIAIRDLDARAFFYNALRKPDFQRETANWSPAKVAELVETFLRGDLIPAVILWQSGKYVFAIDGAHRLSALVAWVHNDYGDGTRSVDYFQGLIPDDQKRIAERTRKLINSSVGTYEEHVSAVQHPINARSEVADRAKSLGTLAIQLQWVTTGDAKKAEDSFFRINQAATAIEPIELRILQSRGSALAVAARAISRGATGHKYWKDMPLERQAQIEEVARDIHNALYVPPYAQPIKTLDLPVGGPGYGGQNLPLIFDLVNVANGSLVPDSTKGRAHPAITPDTDGEATVKYLQETQRLVYRICGNDPSSLGLHPALYFYGGAGSFQPSALIGACRFVAGLAERDELLNFIKVREKFENFFIARRHWVSDVVHQLGSGARSAPWVARLYDIVLARSAGPMLSAAAQRRRGS